MIYFDGSTGGVADRLDVYHERRVKDDIKVFPLNHKKTIQA